MWGIIGLLSFFISLFGYDDVRSIGTERVIRGPEIDFVGPERSYGDQGHKPS